MAVVYPFLLVTKEEELAKRVINYKSPYKVVTYGRYYGRVIDLRGLVDVGRYFFHRNRSVLKRDDVVKELEKALSVMKEAEFLANSLFGRRIANYIIDELEKILAEIKKDPPEPRKVERENKPFKYYVREGFVRDWVRKLSEKGARARTLEIYRPRSCIVAMVWFGRLDMMGTKYICIQDFYDIREGRFHVYYFKLVRDLLENLDEVKESHQSYIVRILNKVRKYLPKEDVELLNFLSML